MDVTYDYDWDSIYYDSFTFYYYNFFILGHQLYVADMRTAQRSSILALFITYNGHHF